jgi:hypothetical protein
MAPSPVALTSWPEVPGYEIVGKLGHGGMGVVYRARQIALNRIVAVKCIRGVQLTAEELTRFRREAEAMAGLAHPNIVGVYDVGGPAGQPFFSMELVSGGSLAQKLAGKPLAADEAARLVETLARAVQHAHDHGIVHRDLKPSNVLLTDAGVPKIGDFGLARRVEGGEDLTRSGAVLGTPGYLAPEQATGVKQVGPAADIYALGAILYECLTGRAPFHGPNPIDTLMNSLSQEPVPPRRLNSRLPRDLETICLKCLEKRPAARYASAAALADDLGRFLRNEPLRARRTGLGQRVLKWARRRPATAAILGLAALLLLGGAGLGLWYWNARLRLKVEYYANWVYRYGEPEGVGLLNEEQVGHRGVSYKLYRRAGRVEALEAVDARGRPTTRHTLTTFLGSLDPAGSKTQVCRYEFQRNDQGQVTAQVARDRTGEVVWSFHYDSPATGHYSDKNGYIRTSSGTGAAYVQFTWSSEGFLQGVRYCDLHQRPRTGNQNIFGYRSETDARGLEVRRTILGADGQPCPCKDGYGSYTVTWNKLGNVTEQVFLDGQGQPTLCRDGYARRRFRYDDHGNQIDEAYFDQDDRPALHKYGYVRWIATYDDRGNMTRAAYLGPDGKPALHKDGNAGWTAAYDDNGNAVLVTYLGTDGRPTRTKNGISQIKRRFESSGNVLEASYFGPDGKPALHKDGNASYTAAYDAQGHLLQRKFYGLDGKPTWIRDGYACLDQKFNSAGQLIEQIYSAVDGKTALCKQGYAKVRRDYDDRGNITAVAYFDSADRPTVSQEGFARLTRRYDSHGGLIEEAYFGPVSGKGDRTPKNKSPVPFTWYKPMLCKDGYARSTMVRDDRGNLIEKAYFDVHDNPVKNKEGFARITIQRDARGQVIAVAYFDPDNKPTFHKDGNAKFTAKYDAQGNRIEEAYLDTRDRPVMVHDGFAVLLMKYNGQGYLVENIFLDAKRKLVVTKAGFARFTGERDPHGNLLKGQYFDAQGKLTESNEGFAWQTGKFDPLGNRIERAYYNRHGKPTAGWHKEFRKYDACGREIDVEYRDGRGRLVPNFDGTARLVIKYDARGNRIERTFFDRHNRPRPDYFKERMTYDDQSHVVETVYLDGKGRPVMCSHGCARWKARYDERGNLIEKSYFDQAGKLRSGWARQRAKYDNRNNQVEVSYWSADDKPALYKDGYACARFVYDDFDVRKDASYFDRDRKPVRTRPVLIQVKVGWQGHNQGLKVGDVVLAYDGKEIFNWMRFTYIRAAERKEDPPRKMEVLRNGKRLTFTFSPGLLGTVMEDRVVTEPEEPEK